MVEKQFNMPIRTIHTDSGGEFLAFTSFLKEQGITHLFTCPYTSEQNVRVERKHRQIVESGLTLLSQTKMSLSFWWEAFHTVVYNINCLLSSPLQNKTPFQMLLKKKPNYSNLHPFGCSAFPCLNHFNKKQITVSFTKVLVHWLYQQSQRF